jgi:arylsulfatase A-like enzyme
MLRDAGYWCGLSGKWHLGRSHRTPRGFDWHFGLPRHQGGHIEEYEYVLNNAPLTLSGNKSGHITDRALDFLDAAPADRPFFLNVGYIATHSPYLGQDPALVSLYADTTFADIPPYTPHPWHKNEGFPQGDDYTRDDLVARYRNYYAAVSEIDRGVGRILTALASSGRLDDTLVIYTADHGCALGHHGFWGKGNSTRPLNMYETSLRVPLIVRPPDYHAGGTTIPRCVDHYDTFQTICDYAGIAPTVAGYTDQPYPGRSYRALVEGESLLDWDDTRYGEYGDLRMIRTPHHKLISRYPTGPDDLFDLRADPGETINHSGDPQYAAIEASLRAQLDAFYRDHTDPAKSGLRVKEMPRHNRAAEAWRDGIREGWGLQLSPRS